MNQQRKQEAKNPKPSKHWVLWTLVVLFIVGAIAAMMMADYYFAPGSGVGDPVPKDAVDK